MSPSCVPAAGRHQRQPRLAARGDRGVVNLHRCLSIIASSLSPVRPLLLQFLFQSPSSINSDNARSSLTKIFILLVSPRRISYVTRIYIYIYRHLITIITITPITSRLLCFQQRPPSGRGSLNWQHPISLRYVPQFTPLVRTSSLSLHPFHAARSTSPRTDIFITRNRSLTLSPSPTYIYIYILHTQRKGSPPPRSPAISREIISLEITTLTREKGGGRIYKEKDRFRRKRKKILGEERPAVSRDNWDTVYYRLRAIVAVCDWIGGDGSREIADPN